MSDLTTAEYAKIAQDFADRYASGWLSVGDGTDLEDPSHTDLQGTNKARRPITGYVVNGTVITFYATFPAGIGDFEWNETGLHEQEVGGHMAMRKVVNSPGTKSGEDWGHSLEVDVLPA